MIPVKSTLSFAEVTRLNESIAEIIVAENIEIDVPMVDELHALLLSQLTAPFSLLINKRFPYSYSYDAQQKLGDIPEIQAIAVLTYSKVTEITTRAVKDGAIREHEWNMKLFSERQSALDWLDNQRK